mgnify:CR=1 FL=1
MPHKSTDVRVVEAALSIEDCPFRSPLKFGGRVMSTSKLMNVTVTVESRKGQHSAGFGSMPVGNIWAWPSDAIAPDQSEKAMLQFAEAVVRLTDALDEFDHPIDIMYTVEGEYAHLAKSVSAKLGLKEPLPTLAQLVAASPLDAALHDAYGRVNNVNSYDALSKNFMNQDLSEYLDDQFKGEYLDQYTSRTLKPRMPLYHLVGALDPLTPADATQPLKDKLPECLADWIPYNGLTHLKIKLSGDDLVWDVDRVLAIDRVAGEAQAKRGCAAWFYSTDFNEKCANVQYVLDFEIRPTVSVSLLAALHALFSEKDRRLADRYIRAIGTGIGVQEGSVEAAVMFRLGGKFTRKSEKTNTNAQAIAIIKGWNHLRTGTIPQRIQAFGKKKTGKIVPIE